MRKYIIILSAMLTLTIAVCACIKIDAECRTNLLDQEAVLAMTPFEPVVREEPEVPKPQLISLGEFTLYHYCPCNLCTGSGNGITAIGTTATEGRTIATDWEVIPAGTRVLIEDVWYTVEDSGSGIKGNKIDVYIGGENAHQRALELGIRQAEVFVLEEVL